MALEVAARDRDRLEAARELLRRAERLRHLELVPAVDLVRVELAELEDDREQVVALDLDALVAGGDVLLLNVVVALERRRRAS